MEAEQANFCEFVLMDVTRYNVKVGVTELCNENNNALWPLSNTCVRKERVSE